MCVPCPSRTARGRGRCVPQGRRAPCIDTDGRAATSAGCQQCGSAPSNVTVLTLEPQVDVPKNIPQAGRFPTTPIGQLSRRRGHSDTTVAMSGASSTPARQLLSCHCGGRARREPVAEPQGHRSAGGDQQQRRLPARAPADQQRSRHSGGLGEECNLRL